MTALVDTEEIKRIAHEIADPYKAYKTITYILSGLLLISIVALIWVASNGASVMVEAAHTNESVITQTGKN